MKTFAARARSLLAADEIEADPRLRLMAALLTFVCYFSLFAWWHDPAGGDHNLMQPGVPVPAWPLSWLSDRPTFDPFWIKGYLTLVIIAGVVNMLWLLTSKDATGPMILLAVLWLHVLMVYLLDVRLAENVHHIHLFVTLIFLIATDKMRFLCIGLGGAMFLSAMSQLTPSWLHAELPANLPGVAPWCAAPVSLVTVGLPLLLPWLWLFRWQRPLRGVAAVLVASQVFWGFLLGFLEPAFLAPALWIAFMSGPPQGMSGYRFVRRHAAAWILLTLAICGTLYPLACAGDPRLTQQGAFTTFMPLDACRETIVDIVVRKVAHRFRFHLKIGPPNAVGDSPLACFLATDSRYRSIKFDPPVMDGHVAVFNPADFSVVNPRTLSDPYFYRQWARRLLDRYQPDSLHISVSVLLNGVPPRYQVMDDEFGPALRADAATPWRPTSDTAATPPPTEAIR